jgi:hypothetical protein
MEDLGKKLFTKEALDHWYRNYQKFEACRPCTSEKGATSAVEEVDEELVRWMDIQRRIQHMLPADLKSKLEALNFDFEDSGDTWEPMYRQLAEYVKTTGHPHLPADDPRYEPLRDWLIRQIQGRRFLSEDQFQKLDLLGVDWEMATSREYRWELMFMKMKEFHQTHGHCRVPQKWPRDKSLANWVSVQRRLQGAGKLREDRKRRLDELGFVWNIKTVFDSQWEYFYKELEAFVTAHGHCQVPGSYPKLVSWIERQRLLKKNKLMLPEREKRLNDLQFVWSFSGIKKSNWNEKFKQLRAYKQKHGHSFVPVNCKENKSLGHWVASQRMLEAKGKLEASKKKKLSDIGFVWTSDTEYQLKMIQDAQWNAQYENLKAYQQEHGTCQVSLKIDPVLQRWTRWQRVLFYQNRLPEDRKQKLDEIRFPFSIQEGYWMKMYEALSSFWKAFGHTRVPFGWPPKPQLAAWVYRTKLNRANLPKEKVALLDQIGFDWTLQRKNIVPWRDMFARLTAFKQQYGHTRVPVKWTEDPKLGKWVSRMRQEKNKLLPERFRLLEAIDFDWGYKTAREMTVKE